jgi:hypothetical protein
VTWLTLRTFLEITVAGVVGQQHRSLHQLRLARSVGIWSSRRPLWADTQPFFLASSENSILYVKEVSNIILEDFSLI